MYALVGLALGFTISTILRLESRIKTLSEIFISNFELMKKILERQDMMLDNRSVKKEARAMGADDDVETNCIDD